jgi:hypothetical protein
LVASEEKERNDDGLQERSIKGSGLPEFRRGMETKRHYQLGVEQVRQNLERANKKVYGKGKVLRSYDGQPVAENEQEMTACN